MRGKPIDLLPITGGLVRNTPPHLVQNGSIIDGFNMWMVLDGTYMPRFGYTPYLTTPPNIGAIIGVWWWIDLNGTNEYIAASPTGLSALVGGIWTTVTGTALTGALADPVKFAGYFQNNIINVLIANNHDPIQVYNTSLASAALLTPTVAATGTNAYVATTVPSFGSIPSNTQFFFTFQNANTGASTLNLNGTGVQGLKAIIGGAVADLPSGYLTPGTTYNVSYDGTEYLIGTNLVAPVARDIAVIAQRVVAINIVNGAVRNFTQVTWTGVNAVGVLDMTVWPALAFQNLVDTDDPLVAIKSIGSFSAVIYGQQSGWLCSAVAGVTDPFAFNFTPIRGIVVGPCSSAAVVVANGLHYYFGVDGRIWECDGTSAAPISQAIDAVVGPDFNTQLMSEVHTVFYPQWQQIYFFYPSKQDGQSGCTRAALYDLNRQIFESIQIFSEVIRASNQEAAQTGVTWNQLTNAWNTYNVPWNSFAVLNSIGVFLGTDAGQVHVFSNASTNDNGASIPYSFTPALLNASTKDDVLTDSFEIYFEPSTTFELTTMNVSSQTMPYATPVNVFNTPFDLSDANTYLLPKTLPTQSKYARYLRLTFFGNSFARAMAFAGGTFFVNTQERPSASTNQGR